MHVMLVPNDWSKICLNLFCTGLRFKIYFSGLNYTNLMKSDLTWYFCEKKIDLRRLAKYLKINGFNHFHQQPYYNLK